MRLGGPPEARARILLIEDDDETAAYVENGLGGGHAVERARDGTDGLVKMLRAGLRASNSPAPQHHVPAGTADHRLLCLLDRRRLVPDLTDDSARAGGPPQRRRSLR